MRALVRLMNIPEIRRFVYLQEMAEGSRLIGIISHVSELKQEIEDQLIVTKDENGSHVKWQIS